MDPVIIFDYFGVLAHRFGQPDESVVRFIEQKLAGKFRLAVLSNMSSVPAETMLGEHVGLFDRVFISGDLGVAKPDQRAFLLAAQRLGEFPESCVMIDDSELNCLAAEAVGMKAILYTGLDDLEQMLQEYGILTP